MSHKYVLVSIHYEGDEPMMYGPESDDLGDIMDIISVEEKLIKAMRKADWNAGVEWIDLAFIQDGTEFQAMWKQWTWLHVGEVLRYRAWRMFIATWKFLHKFGGK